MLNSITSGAVKLVDHLGRSFSKTEEAKVEKPETLHPLDDPREWVRAPAYDPPADVDIAYEQRQIDSIYGTTRGGESIMKLVWSGDRRYWFEYYEAWNVNGQPTQPATKYPMVRYGILRDDKGKKVRDLFPPRWLLLTRIEPEQYANSWKLESYVWAPEIGCKKQIRPDEPPPVFWLWFQTIGHHNDHCCGTKRKEGKVCYGTYARPGACHETLYNQKKADEAAGMHSPFESVEYDMIQQFGEVQAKNPRRELAELQIDAQVYQAHPMALLGLHGSQVAEVDTAAKADKFIKEHFAREIDAVGEQL